MRGLAAALSLVLLLTGCAHTVEGRALAATTALELLPTEDEITVGGGKRLEHLRLPALRRWCRDPARWLPNRRRCRAHQLCRRHRDRAAHRLRVAARRRSRPPELLQLGRGHRHLGRRRGGDSPGHRRGRPRCLRIVCAAMATVFRHHRRQAGGEYHDLRRHQRRHGAAVDPRRHRSNATTSEDRGVAVRARPRGAGRHTRRSLAGHHAAGRASAGPDGRQPSGSPT